MWTLWLHFCDRSLTHLICARGGMWNWSLLLQAHTPWQDCFKRSLECISHLTIPDLMSLKYMTLCTCLCRNHPFESPQSPSPSSLGEYLMSAQKTLAHISAPAPHWGSWPLYWGTPGGYKDTSIELRLPSLTNLEFSGYQTCPWLWQSEAEWKDSPLSDYEFYCSLAPKRCWCFPDMDKVFQWH